jgi:hypothetical protein
MTVIEFEHIKDSWSLVAEPSEAAHDKARRRLVGAASGKGGRRGRRARLIVAFAVVLGLLAAVPALSGTGYGFVVHWLDGSPPNNVKEDVARLDQGAPPGMAQHPIVGKTGLVYNRDTPYGRVRIWLTPTKSVASARTSRRRTGATERRIR